MLTIFQLIFFPCQITFIQITREDAIYRNGIVSRPHQLLIPSGSQFQDCYGCHWISVIKRETRNKEHGGSKDFEQFFILFKYNKLVNEKRSCN